MSTKSCDAEKHWRGFMVILLLVGLLTLAVVMAIRSTYQQVERVLDEADVPASEVGAVIDARRILDDAVEKKTSQLEAVLRKEE